MLKNLLVREAARTTMATGCRRVIKSGTKTVTTVPSTLRVEVFKLARYAGASRVEETTGIVDTLIGTLATVTSRFERVESRSSGRGFPTMFHSRSRT